MVRPFLKPRRRELVTHADEQFASERGGWLVGEQREVCVGGVYAVCERMANN